MDTQSDNIKKLKNGMNARDLVWILGKLMALDTYKKKRPLPTFDPSEVQFIFDLIFKKPSGLLFNYLSDQITNNGDLKYLPMLNTSSRRKISFFYNFLALTSAKAAAIKAGYSPRTAKQQGYRILKEIQGHKRTS